MYGVLQSVVWLSQTEMEPGLSALLSQTEPQSFTTVNAACFMSPAVLIFYTLFNSSPYNIRFLKPRVTRSNCFWYLSCAVVLWRGEVSGKHREDFQPVPLSLELRVVPCSICRSYTALYTKCDWAL